MLVHLFYSPLTFENCRKIREFSDILMQSQFYPGMFHVDEILLFFDSSSGSNRLVSFNNSMLPPAIRVNGGQKLRAKLLLNSFYYCIWTKSVPGRSAILHCFLCNVDHFHRNISHRTWIGQNSMRKEGGAVRQLNCRVLPHPTSQEYGMNHHGSSRSTQVHPDHRTSRSTLDQRY